MMLRAAATFAQGFRKGALILATAAALAVVLLVSLAADRPQQADAAPCQAPDHVAGAGVLQIKGDPACDHLDETFIVYCLGGTIQYFYDVEGQQIPDNNTMLACSAPATISVLGLQGEDDLNLASVTAANGFTGIAQNDLQGGTDSDKATGGSLRDVISGGPGNDLLDGGGGGDSVLGDAGADILQLRDGAADSADCGTEFDAAQTDQQTLDAVANCEIVDFLPAPTPPVTIAPIATAAAESPECATLRAKLKNAKTKKKKRKIRRRLRALGC
jgi:hypothetical protein